MEKSITVYQLKLPKDVSNYICSFVFYTLEQCIEQNKKIHKKTPKHKNKENANSTNKSPNQSSRKIL